MGKVRISRCIFLLRQALTLLLGGSIIFWCSHIYAYNHHSESPLPDTLKGVDAVIWEIFQSLGLKPRIAPFVSLEDEYWNLREWYDEQKIPSEGGDALRRWAAERPGPLLEGPFGVYIHPGGYLDEATQYQELYIGKRGWDGKYHNESQVFLNERPSNKELQILFTAVSRHHSHSFPLYISLGNWTKSICHF